MKAALDDLAVEYRKALQKFMDGAGEASLERAYALGRRALSEGLGVMDMVALQNRVLAEIVAGGHAERDCAATIRTAQSFFSESLSSFEMAHRGFQEVAAALRRLNERSNNMFEEMSRQIATALHDEAWQLIAAVTIDLDFADRQVPAGARVHLKRIRETLQELQNNLRNLSHEIRPKILDDLGIVPAIRLLAKGVSERTGIPVTVTESNSRRFPSAVETGIYRIAQEALINLSRHAGAASAAVSIHCRARDVTLTVQDDGAGFNLQETLTRKGHSGLGLLGIQERVASLGGTLEIDTNPGKGTSISATIPVKALSKAQGSPCEV